MKILVTGANGMIGTQLVKGLIDAGYEVVGVDRTGEEVSEGSHNHYIVDLTDKDKLQAIVENCNVDRFIHLAALAHTKGESDLSWEHYKRINVDCSKNVFDVAGEHPVLFISTIDVFGFYNGKEPVSGLSPIHPVSNYGKSKALAEKECKKLDHYTIFRFCPVYTDLIKRDIQKRYYLKYPYLAYQIGKGTNYEVLNVKKAVKAMIAWCSEKPRNDIKIIKDEKPLWTPDYIQFEKDRGRANIVLYFPQWLVNYGYIIIRGVMGENEKTYLLNKAVHPLRSK